jgi:hypothetical protein
MMNRIFGEKTILPQPYPVKARVEPERFRNMKHPFTSTLSALRQIHFKSHV